jgi:hypothetical protein
MKLHRVFATVTAAAALAGVGAASASADTTGQESVSQNWAGYVAGDSSGSTQFSSVSGSWVQPTAKCGSGQTYSAFWVGIGGSGSGSGALEQTGTQADCNADGSTEYYAWYELVPAAPVRLDLAIKPGDKITGKVDVDGTNVTVSLSDETTGQSSTKTLQMDNPSPDTSSAEWIAEAPSACDGSGGCQPLPLSDFGTVQFTNASATSNGHTGTISDSNWSAQPVALGSGGVSNVSYDADQSSAGAEPSSLSSDGSSFSVAYQQTGASVSASGTGGSSGGSGDYGYGDGGYGYGGYPGADGGYGYGGYPGGDGGYDYGYPGGYGQYGYGGGGYGYGAF